MSKTQLNVQEVAQLRNEPNGTGLMKLAAKYKWSDDETAIHYNEQAGTGGNWTAANVLQHRGWLETSGIWKADSAEGDYAMIGGKRYNITPA